MSNRITDEQVANLHLLGNHLAALPEDYQHFDIKYFAKIADAECSRTVELDEVTAEALNACGSSACGIGHGPAIGIAPLDFEEWDAYGLRVFGAYAWGNGDRWSLWASVFCADWTGPHNHHHALVKRLDAWLADNGYPARASTGEAA